MNIKEIKNKIYAVLDAPAFGDESALLAALNSAARKVALYSRCIKKSVRIFFAAENGKASAALPPDFASFGYVGNGRRTFSRENFEIICGKIKTSALGAGEYELAYFAYTPEVSAESDGETELFADNFAADAVAYGAAMELCASVYPGDVQRYMRIATEYDERMANLIGAASEARGIANGFFAGRGVFI